MSLRFSLVYPTRHRPEFVRQALLFLERQGYDDFEVIVSDNYVDAALSCREICEQSPLPNVRYVRPPEPVGMVENWNFAFQHATGDYVCMFTDKMLLLPETLGRAAEAIEGTGSDIVSWVDSVYRPRRFPDYFGEGLYVHGGAGRQPAAAAYTTFDPGAELSRKGRAEVPRGEQDASSYARGKICFGAFRKELCERIVAKAGALFHPISPDYTSMILGLSAAESAVEIAGPGIVHIITDLSNGARVATHDDAALRFLRELGDDEAILANLPVPGLYGALHNLVAHDYTTLRSRFGLSFDFDLVRWLVYMAEDLDAPDRQWSSRQVESEQKGLLNRFVAALPTEDRSRFEGGLASRRTRGNGAQAGGQQRGVARALVSRTVRSVLPGPVVNRVKQWLTGAEPEETGPITSTACAAIGDILESGAPRFETQALQEAR